MSDNAIKHESRAKQLILFEGMRYKSITPTDVDGFFEISGKVFVFFEIKHAGVECAGGQRLAYERLVDLLPVPTIFLVATHTTPSSESVYARDCCVKEYRMNKQWVSPESPMTLSWIIDWFLKLQGFAEFVL